MKPFTCQSCGQLIFFANVLCERCGHRLGYDPGRDLLLPLERSGDDWRPVEGGDPAYRFCANAQHDVCNWLIPAGTDDSFCRACRHNGTIPDLTQAQNILHWRKLEFAKHQLFYALLMLRLPLITRSEGPEDGLIFEFLADQAGGGGTKVLTGHDNGLIVIALAEADDAEREKRRNAMGEPYRTLLGHFRHEIGHYYWDRLVRDGGRLRACRAVFGDDTEDYGEALQRHYETGAPEDWQQNFVSQYATTHAWEDFAETWAHYLHIVDTMEMAGSFDLQVRLPGSGNEARPVIEADAYEAEDFASMIQAWLPFTIALNSVNRCMGLSDLYPFVLSPAVVGKLEFIHNLVHGRIPGD